MFKQKNTIEEEKMTSVNLQTFFLMAQTGHKVKITSFIHSFNARAEFLFFNSRKKFSYKKISLFMVQNI